MSSTVPMEFTVGDTVRVIPRSYYHYGGGIKPGVVCVVEQVDDNENTPSYRLRAESDSGRGYWYRPEEVEKAERREVAFKDVPPATVFYTLHGGVYLSCLDEDGKNAVCITPANVTSPLEEGQLTSFASNTMVFLDP